MSKVEEIIEQQLSEYRAKFRPVFGNSDHILLVKLSSKLIELEKKLAIKEEASKGAKTTKEEIMRLKREMLFNFKKIT